MNDISFSRVGTRFLTCFPFRPTLRTLSPPPSPLASLHFYRINEFSSCAPVFPGKRREGGGERLLLRHKGCDCENVCFAFRRLPPETRRGGLASSFAQKRPHCFSWRKQCISRISRLAFKDGEGGKWGKRKERSGEGRRKKKGRGKEMEGGRERRKKVVGAAKVREHGLVHAYALDCTEGKNLHGTVSCRSQGNTSVKLNFEQNSRVFRREVFRMYRELTQFSITRTSNPFRYYFSRFERLES